MRKVLLIVSLLLVLGATPAMAVTDGALDRNGHPQVGLMVAFDAKGAPMWRCSGTMIAPRVYLTAGHCTYGADSVQIWFDADVERGIPRNGYGGDWIGDVSGKPYAHPDYDDDGAWWLADVGIVKLDSRGPGPYATLPQENALDKYAQRPRKKKTRFTAVGYGLQKAFPLAASWKDVAERVRMVAHPRLIQINVKGSTGPRTMILSNNRVTGGTCFGDSGGPNFLKGTLTVAGVTSFGKNGTCAGQGGVLRMDRAVIRDWVRSFLP